MATLISHNLAAAVFNGAGTPMELQRFAPPPLEPGDVLVRIRLCSICGSDLHTYHGRRAAPAPTVLGHEAVGEIVEIGAGGRAVDLDGRPLAPGQRITWSIIHHCGECFFCRNDLPQKCVRLVKFGHERITATATAWPLGGLAELCRLKSGWPIVRVPDALPDAVVCPCNCATATVAGLLRAAGPVEGRAVLVQGLGLLGLTACAMLRSRGARCVIATDTNPARRELAGRFGATHSVDADESVARLIGELTEGRGVDLAIELCGAAEAVNVGIAQLRTGGRYLLAGGVFPGPALAISEQTIVQRMLHIQGWHNYAPRDLRDAVQFLERHHGEYPFAELVSDPYGLDEVEEAFGEASRSGAVRVAVAPGMGR